MPSTPNKRKREDEDDVPKQSLSNAVGQLKTSGPSSQPQQPKNPHPLPTNPRPLPTASLHKANTLNSLSSTMSVKQAAAVATQNYIAATAHPSSKFSLLPSAPTGMYQTITKKTKLSKATPPPTAPKPPSKEGASFIDEIINESNDLLQAATEAQSLGRLRSSAGYLLLAHARLVGLGRRFDRSRCLEDEVSSPPKKENQSSDHDDNSNSLQENQDNSNSTILQPPTAASQSSTIILPPMPVAHNTLSDVTLMEHLARSGMELHHKRTGRGMQHDHQMEKMANTPKAKGKVAPNPATASETKEEDLTPTKRKGGRGKKPPTLVMHTLLGAELDAKKLMRISPDS